MACFSPIEAWQLVDGHITFVERGNVLRALTLPCGQCVGCRLERSRQWAVRCVNEAACHEVNSFVTLTYEDAPIGLQYRDFQLFIKRLRKSRSSVRFFMCGEYGENFGRPHFHALLFGVGFGDRVVHSDRGGTVLYRSAELERLWPHGFSSIGEVNFETAAYCARYVMKKVTGQAAEDHYEVVLTSGEVVKVAPEFCRMSLKPGIGFNWLLRYWSDVFSDGKDSVPVFEKREAVPRYYLKLLERFDADLAADVSRRRYDRVTPAVVADNERERLAVREAVVKGRLKLYERTLL